MTLYCIFIIDFYFITNITIDEVIICVITIKANLIKQVKSISLFCKISLNIKIFFKLTVLSGRHQIPPVHEDSVEETCTTYTLGYEWSS